MAKKKEEKSKNKDEEKKAPKKFLKAEYKAADNNDDPSSTTCEIGQCLLFNAKSIVADEGPLIRYMKDSCYHFMIDYEWFIKTFTKVACGKAKDRIPTFDYQRLVLVIGHAMMTSKHYENQLANITEALLNDQKARAAKEETTKAEEDEKQVEDIDNKEDVKTDAKDEPEDSQGEPENEAEDKKEERTHQNDEAAVVNDELSDADKKILGKIHRIYSTTSITVEMRSRGNSRPPRLTNDQVMMLVKRLIPEDCYKITIDYDTPWELTVKYRRFDDDVVDGIKTEAGLISNSEDESDDE